MIFHCAFEDDLIIKTSIKICCGFPDIDIASLISEYVDECCDSVMIECAVIAVAFGELCLDLNLVSNVANI